MSSCLAGRADRPEGRRRPAPPKALLGRSSRPAGTSRMMRAGRVSSRRSASLTVVLRSRWRTRSISSCRIVARTMREPGGSTYPICWPSRTKRPGRSCGLITANVPSPRLRATRRSARLVLVANSARALSNSVVVISAFTRSVKRSEASLASSSATRCPQIFEFRVQRRLFTLDQRLAERHNAVLVRPGAGARSHPFQRARWHSLGARPRPRSSCRAGPESRTQAIDAAQRSGRRSSSPRGYGCAASAGS